MNATRGDPRNGQKIDPDQSDVCACGGTLEVVDMERHLASLPYTAMKPGSDPGAA